MNKAQLILAITKRADISKAEANRALDATLDSIKNTLKDSESVSLVGFGTFGVTERAARTGRNPRTGEAIQIKASKAATFKPAKALKEAVN